MKIAKISLYQVDLPLKEGSYSWSNQTFSAFDSTIVVVQTDSGLEGYGASRKTWPSCGRMGMMWTA
jgi:L-alanine-DL-glutamate epimerase-like enolase superfamily enzyme